MKSKRKVLFVFGTRPEAIKLAPLIKKMEAHDDFDTCVCISAQHREMLDQVLDFFKISPDYDLNIMRYNQSLFEITSSILVKLEDVLNIENPDIVIVQGDTTTAFVGALASFYKKIPIAHVEAGLRSFNKYSPFPEEINRKLVGHIADYHFAPTENARENLLKEGIKNNIWVVGNTVIDALLMGLDIIRSNGEEKFFEMFNFVDFSKKIILVTSHRRESFGKPFENICEALKELVSLHKDIEIIYPVHPNPNVKKVAYDKLHGVERIHLVEPVDYPTLIWLMSKAYIILTDSGGIQEEAPSLGKPVLVLRNVTERIEGIQAGTSKLVGTDKNKIVKETSLLLSNCSEYVKMANSVNPYGDGRSCERIISIFNNNKIL